MGKSYRRMKAVWIPGTPLSPARAAELAMSDGPTPYEVAYFDSFGGPLTEGHTVRVGGGAPCPAVPSLTLEQEHDRRRTVLRRAWENGDIDVIPEDYR